MWMSKICKARVNFNRAVRRQVSCHSCEWAKLIVRHVLIHRAVRMQVSGHLCEWEKLIVRHMLVHRAVRMQVSGHLCEWEKLIVKHVLIQLRTDNPFCLWHAIKQKQWSDTLCRGKSSQHPFLNLFVVQKGREKQINLTSILSTGAGSNGGGSSSSH
jgi:hypothetical protein